MLYYSGKPLFRWSCRDRKALDGIYRSGISPSPKVLLGRAGTKGSGGVMSTYWEITGLTSLMRVLGMSWLAHRLAFAVPSKAGPVRGCHVTLGSWPWGGCKVTEVMQDGGTTTRVEAGRLRYYLSSTGDPYVLLGRSFFKWWGREIFLGYVVLTMLGE